MTFDLIANKAIGQLDFGMDRSDVRELLPGFKGSFKKSKFSKNTTDDFGYCHAFYDSNDKLNAIEFFSGSEILYNDKNLFNLSVNELLELFSDLSEEYGSYISKESSIGITVEDGKIACILIGCSGYYC